MRKIDVVKSSDRDYLHYDWASLTPYHVVNEIDMLDKAHKRSKKALRQQAKAIKRLNERNERLQLENTEQEYMVIKLCNHIKVLDDTVSRLTEERDDAQRALKEQSKEFYETSQRNKDLERGNWLNHGAIHDMDEVMWQRDKFEEERDELKEENEKMQEQLDYKTEQLENEHEIFVKTMDELEFMRRRVAETIDKLNEVM